MATLRSGRLTRPRRNSETVARAFVDRINAHDVDGLVALMTEDHEFIDKLNESHRGRAFMRNGWLGYYRMFPDYRVEIDRVEARGDLIILLGRSSGTLSPFGEEMLRGADATAMPEDQWQGPAIWTARISNGLVAQWRVYADTTDVRISLDLG